MSESKLRPSRSHMSVWEAAHRWLGEDPRSSETSLDVQNAMEQIAFALEQEVLKASSANGVVLKGPSYVTNYQDRLRQKGIKESDKEFLDMESHFEIVLSRWEEAISAAIEARRSNAYTQESMSKLFVDRHQFAVWTVESGFPFPNFWIGEEEQVDITQRCNSETKKDKEGWNQNQQSIDEFWEHLRPIQKTRILCREAAKYLWGLDPDKTKKAIVHDSLFEGFAQHNAQLTDTGTLNDYIDEFDPRSDSERRGPSRKQ